MIGWLSGKVVQAAPDRLILDVGGVGYQVAIPLSTYYEIQKATAGEPDASVRLFIHTHVREDALALYGFWSEREKELFERLIAVSGIGPRLAQVVLSGMAPDELIAALAAGEVATLVRIPGVGKKTAERMVVELRDKMQVLAAQLPVALATAATVGSDSDLVAALVNLGYKPSLAEGAVGAARKEAPEAAFHELLRLALRRLSRV
ncbi:MAG: Holliday junction branch migration protein RuvA [Thermoanaerobaculia bacterium]